MSTHELESKLRELHQLQALIDEASAEAETIKDTIKAHMGEDEELRAGEYKVTWKHVSRSSIDSTALKKTYPDIAAQFTRTTTSRRFCLV